MRLNPPDQYADKRNLRGLTGYPVRDGVFDVVLAAHALPRAGSLGADGGG
jgi:hypothetical protein